MQAAPAFPDMLALDLLDIITYPTLLLLGNYFVFLLMETRGSKRKRSEIESARFAVVDPAEVFLASVAPHRNDTLLSASKSGLKNNVR